MMDPCGARDAVEIAGQLLRGRVAIGGVAGKRSSQDEPEKRRIIGNARSRIGDEGVTDGVDGVFVRVALEEALIGAELVKRRREREDVRASSMVCPVICSGDM